MPRLSWGHLFGGSAGTSDDPPAAGPKTRTPAAGKAAAAIPCADCEDPDACRAAGRCELDEEDGAKKEQSAGASGAPAKDGNKNGDDEEDGQEDGGDEAKAADQTAAALIRQGRKVERARIAAILSAPAAAGRGAFALYLALETGLSAKRAIGLLEAAPQGAAPAAASKPTRLEEAMARLPAADPGPGGGGETNATSALSAAVTRMINEKGKGAF